MHLHPITWEEFDVSSFLRWAGGKQWLAPKLVPILKNRLKDGKYIEPFLGGGAIFFAVKPQQAIISDINQELITTYQVIAKSPDILLSRLKNIPVDADTYYKFRSWKPTTKYGIALRMLYLNRTCYGGLYRTNGNGDFNTPYGGGSRTPDILWKKDLLKHASQIMSSDIEIRNQDFEDTINSAVPGDVIYCDPVYATNQNYQYDRYNPSIFKWPEQIRLRDAVVRAYERGVLVVISNAYHESIRELYKNAKFVVLERKKSIGNVSKTNPKGLEFLIILDPLNHKKEWNSLGTSLYKFDNERQKNHQEINTSHTLTHTADITFQKRVR